MSNIGREALKKRIQEWLFSPKWTSAHTEFDEIEAIADFVETEIALRKAEEVNER